MKRRILSVLLCVVMATALVAFAACAESPATPDKTGNDEINRFTIVFYDENGQLLESKKWDEGATPSYTYTKSGYTFEGWAKTSGGEVVNPLPKVTADASYYAIVKGAESAETIDFGEQATTEEMKSTAAVSMNALNEEATVNATPEQKSAIDLVFEAVQYKVAEVSGTAEEVKQKLNGLYADLQKTVKAIKAAGESVVEIKEQALARLDAIYESVASTVKSATALKSKYEEIKSQITAAAESVNVKEEIDAAVSAFVSYATEQAQAAIEEKVAALKATAIRTLDAAVNSVKAKITNQTLINAIDSFYAMSLAKIESVKEMGKANVVFADVEKDAKTFAENIIKDGLKTIKAQAKKELDGKKDELLGKITDEELKSQIDEFYNKEIAVIDGIQSLDDAENAVGKVKADTEEFVKTVIASQLAKLKEKAKSELDSLVKGGIAKLKSESLKTRLNDFYDTEIAKIEKVSDEESLKTVFAEVKADAEQLIKEVIAEQLQELKDKAKTDLDSLVKGALDKLSDQPLKDRLNAFYDQEIEIIFAVDSIDDIDAAAEKAVEDTKTFIAELIKEKLTAIKAQAKKELDEKKDELLGKITDEELKSQIDEFYNKEIAVIDGIQSLDDAENAVGKVKADTEEFVKTVVASQLAKLKAKAKSDLDEIVEKGLARIKSESLKTDLRNFYNEEIAKIDAISDLDSAKTTIAEIIDDTEKFALELIASEIAELRATVKGYLQTLFDSMNEDQGPYAFIPEAMRAGYAANLVNASDVSYDFTDFVNVADINYGGFGEQWNMVLDNVSKSAEFYKYLDGGQSVMTAALTLMKEHLDSKYADTVDFEVEKDGFNASIVYAEDKLAYAISYKTGINIPMLGEFAPAVLMEYDVATATKSVTVRLGDTNAMHYVSSADEYIFGIKYGVETGSCTAYCSFERKGSSVEGHVYEYITLKGKDAVKSCADFYIGSEYVSVVGNKASGIVAMDGYINELYKTSEGKLLGYEVMETKTIASFTSTYNTLWFNLSDISGITSVKITEKTDANKSKRSPNDVYINGSGSLFVPAYNKKVMVETSRKFDIELRTRFFYGKNAETGEIEEYKVEVPMMFIQEDNDKDTNYSDYPADMSEKNNVTSSVTISSAVLQKIMDDYDTLIEVFKINKENFDSEKISAFIG